MATDNRWKDCRPALLSAPVVYKNSSEAYNHNTTTSPNSVKNRKNCKFISLLISEAYKILKKWRTFWTYYCRCECKRIIYPNAEKHISTINLCKINCYNLCDFIILTHGRVDVIWRFHLGILCIPCCSSLSIEECHNILPYERASTPLTEPDLKISLIRLFSMLHSTVDGQ